MFKGTKHNKKFGFIVEYENYNRKDKVDKREFFNEKGERI